MVRLNHRFNRSLTFVTLMLALMIAQSFPSTATPAQAADCQFFPETGFSACGRFLTYWQTHGGLAQQGFPITNEVSERNASPPAGDGQLHTVQYFERARFELHLENAAPYDVLLGLLGTEQYNAKYLAGAKDSPIPGCQYFSETGFNLCGEFLTYWQAHGGLAQQGFPISRVMSEQNQQPPAGDGQFHQVQYFQRARFEQHMELGGTTLLGLLGTEQYKAKYGAPQPPATNPNPPSQPSAPAVLCQGFPAGKDSDIYPSACMTRGTFFWMAIKGFTPNEQIGYWLNDPSGQPVAGTRTTYNVGSTGNVSFTNPVDTGGNGYYNGVWSWVFEGTTSHHQSIIYFKIQDEAGSGLSVVSANGAGLGGTASLVAKTSPGANCNLDYYTPSGNRSAANGLGNKTADGTGNVSWSWFIGTDTHLGSGYVAVTCNNLTAWRNITISASAAPSPAPTPTPTPAPTAPPASTPEQLSAAGQLTYPTANCVIKGNISESTGEKIYHVPGQAHYDETVIDPSKGERWFCTEQDAVNNGWRKSKV